MPQKQLIQQMDTHLPGWREKFADFDLEPFAAASIGQGNGWFSKWYFFWSADF